MLEKRKLLEQYYQERKIRQQSLHLSVIYESRFIEKLGKKRLEYMRDELLDRINELTDIINQIDNELNQ